MAVYIFTGKLGGGKTLCAVGRIRDKLNAGCIVATNLDLRLEKLTRRDAKNVRVIRIPDKPKLPDLENIGRGNLTYDESTNGLLVLDECGTWFNSRSWNDKERKPVNDWFLHARKLGWDVILIIQDISLLDSQAREALAEHTAFCKRLDRIAIPYLGSLVKMLTGYQLHGPKVHSARVVYGTSPKDFLADRHVYRGTDLFAAYDTKQLFLADYPHGVHSLLTPWHRFGRYAVKRNKDFYMRLTRIYWKRFQGPLALGTGALVGMFLAMIAGPVLQPANSQELDTAIFEQLPAVQSEELLPVPEPEPEPTIVDLFMGFQLTAYIEDKKRVYYTISNDDETFDSEQLRKNGFIVTSISNCEVAISRREEPRTRHHIFSPNCLPLKYDHEMYDVSKLNVPEFAGEHARQRLELNL